MKSLPRHVSKAALNFVVIIIILALLSIVLCLFSCDGHKVHLGGIGTTPFIFTAALWDIAAVSERTEGMNSVPKVRQENLWVEQEIKVVPLSVFARPWTGAGSAFAALLICLQIAKKLLSKNSFQKTAFKVAWLLGHLQIMYKGSVFLYRPKTFSALLTKGCLEIIKKD